MKEPVLPISTTDSSSSTDSVYSFSQESESTSPPHSSHTNNNPHLPTSGIDRFHATVSVETAEGFQNLAEKSTLTPKMDDHTGKKHKNTHPNTWWARIKSVAWKLYIVTPFLVISLFSILIIYEKLSHLTSYNNSNGFYTPDLPSSFESLSKRYDNLNIEFYDLNDYKETLNGWQRGERILFCVPLRDASQHLPMFFGHMKNLTYPHNLIDLLFLISDTTDSTIKDLKKFLKEFQTDPNLDNRFGRINIYEKDFGQVVGQTFSDRHGFALQGPRRKLMAILRNWLLSTLLRPDHSWVYWRDIDVETCPGTIIEDLMHHNKDVIVPNVWRPLPDWLDYEQPYDLNSWQESEAGIELLDKLDEDLVIVEGYSEYATWRPHLAYLRDPNGDEEVEMELDGIGGVSILAKLSVFRSGAHFPLFSFQKHAETELFGKLCKYMGFSVIGLPHYTIWHIYEPSSDDLKHMEWMAQEEKLRFEKLKLQKIYDRSWKLAFDDVSKEWDNLKFNVFKNTDLTKFRQVDVDWNEVDEYLQDVNDQTINYDHFLNEKDEEVRNYDQNDPLKFIFNKYSHKKSEIDLKFRLNEFDKQKSVLQTDDFMNYGINKGEDLFGSFPINPYLSGKNPNSMRFVKFKKNEIIKFDEPENKPENTESENGEDSNEKSDGSSEENSKKGEEAVQQLVNDINVEDQSEPDEEAQKLMSHENIRQEAMAQALLKQKKTKQEKELLNQKEKVEAIVQGNVPDAKEKTSEIISEKVKQSQNELSEKQKSNNLALANKKKKLNDQNVNLKDASGAGSSLAKSAKGSEEDLESKLQLKKIEEKIELENSINDAKILQKIKNYENDKINPGSDDAELQVKADPIGDESEKKETVKPGKADSEKRKITILSPKKEPAEVKKDKLEEPSVEDSNLDSLVEKKPVKEAMAKMDNAAKDGSGLVDDINIGGSKEKLSGEEPNNIKDEAIVPKKEDSKDSKGV